MFYLEFWLYMNSIIDPVEFFVVYRRKWQHAPTPRVLEISLAYIARNTVGANLSST